MKIPLVKTARSEQEVIRGAYLSLAEFNLLFVNNDGERLPGKPDEQYVRIPLLLVPMVLVTLATFFMMFVPGLAIFGSLYFLFRKMVGKGLWFLVAPLALTTPCDGRALTPEEIQEANEECFFCHAESETYVQFHNGERIQIYIPPADYYRQDVHATEISCAECHVETVLGEKRQYTESWHPQIQLMEGIKEYRLKRDGLCQPCHEEQYESYEKSMHAKLIREGDQAPPVCTDCHPVHVMKSMKKNKKQVIQTCAKCHDEIYDQYQKSVHGREILKEGNPDVPSCVNCHAAHKIDDPRELAFHIDSPEICAECHADEELMDKYDLRSEVYETYLDDFHGVSIQFYQKTGKVEDSGRIEAVCVDCHGVHDIDRVHGEGGVVDRVYVDRMCNRCHEKIPGGFSSAWLAHYRPSPTKYPLIFMAKMFYGFFIPFTILGLAIHLFLHFRYYRAKMRGQKDEDHG